MPSRHCFFAVAAAAAAASTRWNGSCSVVVTQLTDAELTDNYLNVDIMIVSRHHDRRALRSSAIKMHFFRFVIARAQTFSD